MTRQAADELAAQAATSPLDPSRATGARPVDQLPRFVEPELATLVDSAPEDDLWLHEVKFDGYRALTRLQDGKVEIRSRNDRDWTDHFRLIADDVARLPADSALLDGEVVMQMPDGRTSFQALQNSLGADTTGIYHPPRRPASDLPPAAAPATPTEPGRSAPTAGAAGAPVAGGRLLYYVFDLLYLNGYELLGTPIEERKELLRRLMSKHPGGPDALDTTGTPGRGRTPESPDASRLRFSEHIAGGGREFLSRACRLGLEGIVSKKTGGRYRPGARGAEWQKTKCLQEQEFVVGGYTDPSGTRVGFGALLLGVNEAGHLRYVGKVGTGFSEKLLRSLGERLRSLEIEDPPFAAPVARLPQGAHWTRPELVAEVAFAEWTAAGGLRHPSFKGVREDKRAGEVVAEGPR